VDNLLINMSERSTDLLKYLGGPAQFTFNNPKVEWVEDDVWSRRLSSPSVTGAGTTLTITGQAHRYPVGTLLLHVTDGEIARVVSITDANTVEIQRDVPNVVSEGTWSTTDEVIVAGHAMAEDADWVFRPSAIFQLPYNYAQVHSLGIQVTFRRQSVALYGLRGTDLDMASANTVAEQFVAMEQELVSGYRFVGYSAARPALLGGLRFFIRLGGSTESGSAVTTDYSPAAITRKDIDDDLQELFYSVGPEKMAKTLLVPAWAKRKISSLWSSAERLGPGATSAGIAIDRFNTDFGAVEVLLHTALAKNEMYLLNRDMIKMGCFEGLGRPHLLQLAAPSATGPRVQRAFYADVSCMVKGVQGMGCGYGFSTTS
jgi:hypothetical protein